MSRRYDAVVVGAGPNGLAASITLSRAGRSVLLVEAAGEIGGGTRSAALTMPGFVHDVCSSVHPLVVASPFFRSIGLARLAERGAVLDHPPTPLAHPLDGGRAAVLHRGLRATAEGLGADGPAYERLMRPLVARADGLLDDVLGAPGLPRHLVTVARFGPRVLRSAAGFARSAFRGPEARALLAGNAAHAVLPLTQSITAVVGLLFAVMGHAYGWPVVRSGSQRLAEALGAELRALGGEIRTGRRVTSLAELPPADRVMFDLTPRQVLAITGDALPAAYRRRLSRYRYGPGVFKLDWALDGPVPWTAEGCRGAGTVHVGGTLAEVASAEAEVAAGRVPQRPFVLLAQPGVADGTRAPRGRSTAWAYCHVPNGCPEDMTEAIERQVERFAPGFRDRILATHAMGPAAMEAHNENCVGGDIGGGVQDLRQLFTRPVAYLPPYATPNPRLWLCSSSTPPGGGVHGMCGVAAAEALLRRSRPRNATRRRPHVRNR